MFLAGIGAAAVVPVVGKAANLASFSAPKKGAKHRIPVSGTVLAAQWQLLVKTKLAGQIPPGLARQIYRRLAGK
jgi:hypothetical protein